jgi:hypothetical protein
MNAIDRHIVLRGSAWGPEEDCGCLLMVLEGTMTSLYIESERGGDVTCDDLNLDQSVNQFLILCVSGHYLFLLHGSSQDSNSETAEAVLVAWDLSISKARHRTRCKKSSTGAGFAVSNDHWLKVKSFWN